MFVRCCKCRLFVGLMMDFHGSVGEHVPMNITQGPILQKQYLDCFPSIYFNLPCHQREVVIRSLSKLAYRMIQ